MTDEKVDLNQATISELKHVPGIGDKLADRIIKYREDKKEFSDLSELTNVSGISDRMVEEFALRFRVGESLEDRDAEVLEVEEPELARQEGPPYSDDSATVIEVSPEGEAVIREGAGAIPPGEVEPIEEPVEESVDQDQPEQDAEATVSEGAEEIDEVEAILGDQEDEEDEKLTDAVSEAAAPVSPEDVRLLESADDGPTDEEHLIAMGTSQEDQQQPQLIAGYILSALAGAFLGAVLVLLFLLLINRTLRFAGDNQATQQQQQLEMEIKSLNQGQENLRAENEKLVSEINALEESLVTTTNMQAGLADSQTELQGDVVDIESDIEEVNSTLAELKSEVVALEEETTALDERLGVLADSAENFDKFLNGMRDLLLTLQGPPPTVTGTATTGTVTPTGTVTAEPSSTRLPTRTPRPTATPISLPSPTPES